MTEPTIKLGPYFTFRCAVCGAKRTEVVDGSERQLNCVCRECAADAERMRVSE